MHLQVQPHILCLQDIDDVFVSLAEALRRASDAYVVELAETSLKRINALLYPKEVNKYNYDIDIEIPTIIDEAQEGLFQLPNAFLTASSTDEMGNFRTRPFLREVAAHWSTFHASDRCSVQFIITGTDLSLNHPRKGSIAKLDLWSVAVFMGSFRDRDELHAYLNRYLPSSLLDSPEGKVLLERIWYWLRGRYVSSSMFVAQLPYLCSCQVSTYGFLHPVFAGLCRARRISGQRTPQHVYLRTGTFLSFGCDVPEISHGPSRYSPSGLLSHRVRKTR